MSSNALIGSSFATLLIATLFIIIAFSTSYWLESTQPPATGTAVEIVDYHFGLWTTCYRETSTSSDVINNETVTSAVQVSDWMCADTARWIVVRNNGWRSSWLDGFQATVTIAFILCLGAAVCLFFYACGASCWSRRRPNMALGFIYITSVTAFATACFLLLGLIICGTKPYQDDSEVRGASLSWSWFLALTADIVLWCASGITYAEFSFLIAKRR